MLKMLEYSVKQIAYPAYQPFPFSIKIGYFLYFGRSLVYDTCTRDIYSTLVYVVNTHIVTIFKEKTYGTLFVVLVATVKGSEEIYQNSIIKAPNTRDPENPYEMMPVERKYKVRIHRFFKVPPLCGELVNSSIIVILTELTQ